MEETPNPVNVAAELASCMASRRSGLAVCSTDSNEIFSCEILLKSIREIAGALRGNGVLAGKRIALVGTNSTSFIKAYYGILYAGGVVVPLSAKLPPMLYATAIKGAEVYGAIVSDCDKIPNVSTLLEAILATKPEFLWCDANSKRVEHPEVKNLLQQCGNATAMQKAVQLTPDAEAVILGTSGTTGPGKGVRLSHQNLLAGSRGFARRTRISASSNVLVAMPLTSSFGQVAMMTGTLLSGGVVNLHEPFKPQRIVETLSRQDVTHFVGVPTMYAAMTTEFSRALGHDDTTKRNLRGKFYGIGGAPVPPDLVNHFSHSYGVSLRQGYGLTETASIASFTAPDVGLDLHHAGLPIDNCAIQIIGDSGEIKSTGESGEIVVSGENVMLGYLGQTALHYGLFRTGDIGYKDASGNIVIIDRIKDLIIRGGENIYPRSVESCITSLPEVAAAAVVGKHDEYYGEVPVAFIVRKNSAIEESQVREYLATRLPLSNVPVKCVFLEELPVGPTGKVLKRELRALIT